MRRKKWIVLKGDKEFVSQVSQDLNIDPMAALIVSSRGMNDMYEMEDYFDEDAPLTLYPEDIKDMKKASDTILEYIDNGKRICVYGDYDCDGVTSTALLYSYLKSIDADVVSYIPDRITEGYGLNCGAVDSLKKQGVELIVTVDNGVTAVDEIKYAYSLGLKVVVTDHHKLGDELPECEAIVDPHRTDCPSSFKEMSGVGVAFKLISCIEGHAEDELLEKYGDLVAIGTIGDVVPLVGENRVFVKRGIKNIAENPRPGVKALIEASGMKNKTVNSSSVAFTICPRINAAGRISSANLAYDLLLSESDETASELAKEINDLNARRQSVENDIFKSALKIIESDKNISDRKIIVVSGEGWHQGVVGIVAAKLTEHYGRPSIVISVCDGDALGSCRSIEGFSIYDALESVSDILTHFGGHTLAAGVGLNPENIDEFRDRINKYAENIEMPFATQKIDCRINLSSVSLDLLPSLKTLEPFGAGNQQPVFGLFGVTIDDYNGISEGKHTRMFISKNGIKLSVIYFNMPDVKFPFERGSTVDLAVNLEKNIYNNEERISVLVRGIRYSDMNEDSVLENISLYDKFSRNERITPEQASRLIPDRDIQVEVFKSIAKKPVKDFNCETICVRLADKGDNLGKYLTAVNMMTEMGILYVDSDNCIQSSNLSYKVNLHESQIYKRLLSIRV